VRLVTFEFVLGVCLVLLATKREGEIRGPDTTTSGRSDEDANLVA